MFVSSIQMHQNYCVIIKENKIQQNVKAMNVCVGVCGCVPLWCARSISSVCKWSLVPETPACSNPAAVAPRKVRDAG